MLNKAIRQVFKKLRILLYKKFLRWKYRIDEDKTHGLESSQAMFMSFTWEQHKEFLIPILSSLDDKEPSEPEYGSSSFDLTIIMSIQEFNRAKTKYNFDLSKVHIIIEKSTGIQF